MKITGEQIKAYSESKGFAPVKVTLLEKTGNCPHEVGEGFSILSSSITPIRDLRCGGIFAGNIYPALLGRCPFMG